MSSRVDSDSRCTKGGRIIFLGHVRVVGFSHDICGVIKICGTFRVKFLGSLKDKGDMSCEICGTHRYFAK